MGKKADLSELTINQLTELTGRTARTIKKRLADVSPVRTTDHASYYSPREALPAIFLGDPKPNDSLDLTRERARLAREQADATAIKNAQARNELAPISLLTVVLGKVCTRIAAILETIPGNVKRRVPRLTASEVELIKREIVKAQNIAARVEIDLSEYAGSK